MSSPRLVYLHVGPPKTGTTFLQDVIWRNHDTLASHGIGVPGENDRDHFRAVLDLRDIAFGGYDDPRVRRAWPRLMGMTRRLDTPQSLISHEIFAGSNERQIAKVVNDLAPAEVHVIYGVRDLGRQLPAVWQEMLKNRQAKTYGPFLRKTLRRSPDESRAHFWRAQGAVGTLSRWSAAVPAGRIHVVTIKQPGAPGGTLLERFFSILGVDAAGLDTNVARTNPSLTQEDAELLVRLNQALPDDLAWPSYERLVKLRFRLQAENPSRGRRLVVPARHKALVLERSAEIRTGLQAAGYDIVGDLDELIPLESAFGGKFDPDPNRVADAAVDMLADALVQADTTLQRQPRERARQLMVGLRRGRGRS